MVVGKDCVEFDHVDDCNDVVSGECVVVVVVAAAAAAAAVAVDDDSVIDNDDCCSCGNVVISSIEILLFSSCGVVRGTVSKGSSFPDRRMSASCTLRLLRATK